MNIMIFCRYLFSVFVMIPLLLMLLATAQTATAQPISTAMINNCVKGWSPLDSVITFECDTKMVTSAAVSFGLVQSFDYAPPEPLRSPSIPQLEILCPR